MPEASATRPYSLTISLNILNHLGINLYSNVPAVLAEVVANFLDLDDEEDIATTGRHRRALQGITAWAREAQKALAARWN